MTYAIGDPDHIEVHESIRLLFMAAGLDPDLIPGTATIGATGHVDDHNKIADAIAWLDANGTFGPPAPTVIEGSSTNATFATLTDSDGDGYNYRKATWTTSGSLVLATGGWVYALVVAAGGSYVTSTADGEGGRIFEGWLYLAAGTHTVTIGAATAGSSWNRGGFSLLGPKKCLGGIPTTAGNKLGAGDGTNGEYTSTISGSSQKYAGGGFAVTVSTTTYGSGGELSGWNPQNGVVIARWRTA